jgi:hypothetical protein
MKHQPKWRRAFDRAERTVGKPLEQLVASRRYLDVALFGRRLRRTAGSVVQFPASAARRVVNLKTRRHSRRLDNQVAAVSNEVREMATGVDQLRTTAP